MSFSSLMSWNARNGAVGIKNFLMPSPTLQLSPRQAQRLNWLFSKLGGEGAGMMDVLYCVLNDSPEALNMMQEEHIRVIISLLEKFGRDPKVLDILCNLCKGSGVAVRSSQNNIVDFLLPGKNLLLHSAVVDQVASSR